MKQRHPMISLAQHELKANAPTLMGQIFIIAIAGGLLGLMFSILRLSQANIGMPENARHLATNMVIWVIVSCLAILPQVGRFGIDRRRYDYACWSIAGLSFKHIFLILLIGNIVVLFSGILLGVLISMIGAPLLGMAPISVNGEPLFVPGISLIPSLSDYVKSFLIVAFLIGFFSTLSAWRISRTPPRLALADIDTKDQRSLFKRIISSNYLWFIFTILFIVMGALAADQSGLFISMASIFLLIWIAGLLRGSWMRFIQKIVIRISQSHPIAYASSGLAVESIRTDPIVLYPLLLTMGGPAIIVSVARTQFVNPDLLLIEDIATVFFGPLVLAMATAIVGLWLGASSLEKTVNYFNVLGLTRKESILSAGISQVYLVSLSLLLSVVLCFIASLIEMLIVGLSSYPSPLHTILQSPPYLYLFAIYLITLIPSIIISMASHGVKIRKAENKI